MFHVVHVVHVVYVVHVFMCHIEKFASIFMPPCNQRGRGLEAFGTPGIPEFSVVPEGEIRPVRLGFLAMRLYSMRLRKKDLGLGLGLGLRLGLGIASGLGLGLGRRPCEHETHR